MPTDTLPLSPAKKHRIFLLDDHSIFRAGLRCLLEAEPDLAVCGEAESGEQAFSRIDKAHPDLVMIDLSLPGSSGIELIKNFRSRYPDLHMLVLSMHDESLYAERVLRAGAKGYVMKQESADQLIAAVRRVLRNEVHLSPSVCSRVLEGMVTKKFKPRHGLEQLSDRELEILNLIGKGLMTAEIAAQLGISGKTVETHRGNLRRKLGLRTGAELVRFALAHAPDRA